MGKLHELLAVEGDIKGTAEHVLKETINTFTKKQDHFNGMVRHLEPASEQDEPAAPESKEIVTTVADKLKYTEDHLTKLFDLIYTKESANCIAAADLTLGGKLVATGVPATVLLQLENKLKGLKEIFAHIPTLDPALRWEKDAARDNVYRTPEKETYRTKKVMKAVVLYAHTDKHPAQVEKVVEDVRSGTWKTTQWTGMVSPSDKSRLMSRLDEAIQAVKQARMRANDVEVTQKQIGRAIFEFIHG